MSNYLPWLVIHFVCLVCMYGAAAKGEPTAVFYFIALVVLSIAVPRSAHTALLIEARQIIKRQRRELDKYEGGLRDE